MLKQKNNDDVALVEHNQYYVVNIGKLHNTPIVYTVLLYHTNVEKSIFRAVFLENRRSAIKTDIQNEAD